MLCDVCDGPAILAAEAQALDHSQTEKNDGGSEADLIEGRDQPNCAGAQRHAAKRYEERVFAADTVAHPAEQKSAERTNEEAGGEQSDGAEQRRTSRAISRQVTSLV